MNLKGEKNLKAQLSFPGSIFLHGIEFLHLIPKLVYYNTAVHKASQMGVSRGNSLEVIRYRFFFTEFFFLGVEGLFEFHF